MILSVIGIVLSVIAIGLIFYFKKDQQMTNHWLEGETEAAEHGYKALMRDFTNYQVETDRKIAELEKKLEIKTKQLDRKTDKTIKSDLSTITSDGKTFPKGLSGPMETFGGKGGSTYSDTIDSISDFATYEESDGGNEILLAPSSSTGGKTQSGNQVVKEKIVQISVDTSDPYEVLYRG